MRDWNYAKLTKSAKEAGGPENYVQLIRKDAYDTGKKDQLVTDGIIILGVGAVYVGYKSINWIKSKFRKARYRKVKLGSSTNNL